MIPSSKQVDSPLQQSKKDEINKVMFGKGLPSSSSPLLRSKDPRIVRVSRALGGKDRHSKVFTVRGLRDRRVRLSVPTAIQLYDLQDRLGLNQPSKVVDWLLNEAKHEIEELPPLPNMPSFNHQMVPLNAPQEGLKDPEGGFWRATSKEIAMESSNDDNKGSEGHQGGQVPMPMPFGSYYHFEPSNFGLSHIGSHGYAALPHSTDQELYSTSNSVPLSSTLSLPSGSQISDPRQQVNHFQMLMASGSQNPFANPPPYSMSQHLRPFHLSITPRLQHDKEHEFPPK